MFNWTSDVHELPVLDLVVATGLPIEHLMIALLCAPCRLHSVNNRANVQNETAHGVYKAMKDGKAAM